jgi:hypothetical protein
MFGGKTWNGHDRKPQIIFYGADFIFSNARMYVGRWANQLFYQLFLTQKHQICNCLENPSQTFILKIKWTVFFVLTYQVNNIGS